MSLELFVSALVLGLFGAAHCIGMCGGIGAALNVAISSEQRLKRIGTIVSYNFGRLFSYSLIGGLAASLGAFAMPSLLRIIAGVLLILMGLYLADISHVLKKIEKLGSLLWRHIQPLSSALLPVKNPAQALLLGMLWGWLPCGLVYSALAMALVQGSTMGGAAFMLFFGLGTLPAVVAGAIAADGLTRQLQKKGLRLLLGLLMALMGAWTIFGVFQHAGHANHSAHAGHSAHSEHTANAMSADDHSGHEQHMKTAPSGAESLTEESVQASPDQVSEPSQDHSHHHH
ncbi:sulfite exporter TauE/SafE family protein [Agaribacterium sp. ZY112]|uniref:sulfite exporter TauE/SafE family protein n=1 Tax=Agaribacterium sp. ZY112 TaxID=3233574 RepID=UPI0035231780